MQKAHGLMVARKQAATLSGCSGDLCRERIYDSAVGERTGSVESDSKLGS